MKKILFTILAVLMISLSTVSTLAIGESLGGSDSDSDSSSDSGSSDSGISIGQIWDNLVNWLFPKEGETISTDLDPLGNLGNPGDSTNWDTDSDQAEDEIPDEKNDPIEEGTKDDPSTFEIDQTAPIIVLTISPNNPVLNQKIKIKAVASDESGISSLEIKVDNNKIVSSTSSVLETEFTVTEKKTYTVEAVAMDTKGNTGAQKLVFTAENTLPSLEVSDVTVYEGEEAVLKVRTFDAEDANDVIISFKPVANSKGKTANIDKQGRWRTHAGDAGEYAITVTAEDKAGGQTVTTANIRVVAKRPHYFVIDSVRIEDSAMVGEDLSVAVFVRNEFADEEEMEISVNIPELAVKAKAEISELKKGDSDIINLVISLPSDIQPGEYGVVASVTNSDYEGELYFTSLEVYS